MNATKGATIKLTFKIGSVVDPSKLRKADLWLFLEPFPSGEPVNMHLRVEGEATNISRRSIRRPVHTWDSRRSCIPIDVTGVVRKLFRFLQREEVEKAVVKITVTLKNVAIRAGVRPRVISSGNTCKALETAGCKQRPFLILKYYVQRVYGVDAGALTSNFVFSRHSNSTPSPTTSLTPSAPPSPTNSPTPSAPPSPNATLPSGTIAPRICSLVDLTVNLTKFSYIVGPKTINIKDCAGICPVTPTHDKFTFHAILKHRVASLNSCCVPTEFGRAIVVVLRQDNIYELAVLKDAVVKACGCR